MNIRHRIVLLVVLSFLAILLIGGFAVYQGRGSAREVKTVTQGVVPSALASAELVGQLKDVQLSVMAIMSAADLKLVVQAEERLQATQMRLQKAFDLQILQADSDAQRGLVLQAKESLANYFAAIRDTVAFKLKGQKNLAEANMAANVGGYLQEMEAVIETLQIEKRRSKDDAITALNDNLSGTTSTISVVTVIAVLVLGGMGLLLYRQIIIPISEMERMMTQIATSQDFSQRLIGEDEMNFGFNAHLLPSEISKTMFNGQTKILDLNWSPITDEQGTTRRILLCVRDVTEVRAMAFEAQVQKRELNIIGEILAVEQEKFHAFVEGASQFLTKNRRLIEDTPLGPSFEDRQPVITQLFRNMHTIKGNARTYGLLHLTHVVHEAEQTYDSLRASEETVWDRDYLLQQLDATRLALDEYVHINAVKLGHRGADSRGLDHSLLVEKQHIAATLTLLDQADGSNGATLREALRQARHHLELMGTLQVQDVLAGVLESLPALAKELGKPAPVIHIQSNGIVLRAEVAALLKNVCMHLYRNAIDHGLESAAQRAAQGKSPAGHVQLDLRMQGEQLAIRLRDDGRGLAVAAIRRQAIERRLIEEDTLLSDTQIAQLVLRPGFSTATQVTEVSGRGVGMDAVKGFVEAEGGSLTLEILDTASSQDYRPFETLILLPGKFALAPTLRLLQQAS